MTFLKVLVKKNLSIIFSLLRKDLDIDMKSNISPKVFKAIKGSRMYKVVFRNSLVLGNISAEQGCKFLDVYCTGNIKLGQFVSLNGPATRISSRLNGIEIGSFSSIASNVVIQEDYHRSDKVSTYFMNQNIFKGTVNKDIYSKGKIFIEEDVWIGSNSVILSGVRIGRGSIIGAGSIVTKDIPRYSIVGGNPAKVIRKRFKESIIQELENSKWWEYDIHQIIKYKKEFNENLIRLEEEDIPFLLFDKKNNKNRRGNVWRKMD